MENANIKALKVWLVLVLLTLASYAVGKLGYGGITVATMLLISISLKGQLIIDHFMGLARVHSRLKWVVTGWLVSVVSLIGVAYWIST